MPPDRLAEIVGRVLSLDPSTITDGTSSRESPRWDSVGHLNLVLEVEAEFGVRFSAEEIPELVAVGKIRETLLRMGALSKTTEASSPPDAAGS